jgi:Ca2+-binding EF-hand superfamily protein
MDNELTPPYFISGACKLETVSLNFLTCLPLFESETPDDVVAFVWNLDPFPQNNGKQVKKFNETVSSLHAPDIKYGGVNSLSIHHTALQQSRAIVDDPSSGETSSDTYKRVNSEVMVTKHTLEHPFDKSVTDEEKKNFITSLTSMEDTIVDAVHESKHIESIHGHVDYKWDQQLMLHIIFSLLDKGNKGYLTLSDMYTIANNTIIHSILRFTVLWSYVKKKKWDFFYSLFEYKVVEKQASNLVSLQQSTLSSATSSVPIQQARKHFERHKITKKSLDQVTLKLADWMNSIEFICTEKKKILRHIRLHDEHLEICRNIDKGSFAKAGHNLINDFLPERDCARSRQIAVGDCVWSLHNNGVVWLQAVVEKVNTSYEETAVPANGGHYTYDLWYPLNEVDLQLIKQTTASRKLLSLPSQQDNEAYCPKPFLEERKACSFAFDLVDEEGNGYAELNKLIYCFQSPEFKKIVETSLSLTIIFGLSSTNSRAASRAPTPKKKQGEGAESVEDGPSVDSVAHSDPNCKFSCKLDHEIIPCLLPVFIDTFSSENEGDEFNDVISKSDFLHFCDAVIDIKKYSIAGQAVKK